MEHGKTAKQPQESAVQPACVGPNTTGAWPTRGFHFPLIVCFHRISLLARRERRRTRSPITRLTTPPPSHPYSSTTEATKLNQAEHLHSDPNPTVPHKPASSLVEGSIMIQLTTTNTHVAKEIQFMDGNNDVNMQHGGGRRGQYS